MSYAVSRRRRWTHHDSRIELVRDRLASLNLLTVRVVVLEYSQLHKKPYNLVCTYIRSMPEWLVVCMPEWLMYVHSMQEWLVVCMQEWEWLVVAHAGVAHARIVCMQEWLI